MRRTAKIDANQPELVAVFKRLGFSVCLLHQIGGGCPDILIGKHRKNHLIEIKDGKKSPSKRKLTEDQKQFHDAWRGDIFVVESVLQALELARKLDQGK